MEMLKLNNMIKTGIPVFLASLPLLSQSAWAYRQPHMEDTLRDLYRARESLERAVPNKGGHRARALRSIDRAIMQVNKGIDFANRKSKHRIKKYQGKHQDRGMRNNNQGERKAIRRDPRY